jgi:hypothetical protein
VPLMHCHGEWFRAIEIKSLEIFLRKQSGRVHKYSLQRIVSLTNIIPRTVSKEKLEQVSNKGDDRVKDYSPRLPGSATVLRLQRSVPITIGIRVSRY